MKKLLSVLLVFVMLLSLAPVALASEETAETESVEEEAPSGESIGRLVLDGAAIIDSLMASAMVGPGTSYDYLTYTLPLNDEEYGVGFRKGSDAAAALVGAAQLWGIAPDDPAIIDAARALGADVAFFLRGGCAYLEGTGADFVHALEPSKQSVVLVKPEGGVSTAEAYRQFDANPTYAIDAQAAQVRNARTAADIRLFNNLAPAAEALLPELADIRAWLAKQPGAQSVLLCGSGACTFATCEDFSSAATIAAAARKRGWWSRTTSLGSARVLAVSTDGTTGVAAGAAAAGAGTAGAGA